MPGRLTLNVIGDKLLATPDRRREGRLAQVKVPVGSDWGTGAYLVATLRRPLDAPAQRMPGRAIGVQWFSIDRAAKTLTVDLKPPALLRPNTTLRLPVKVGGLAAGEEARIVGRRRRCRHPQSDQLQAAVAERLLSRPARAVGRHPRPLWPI